MIWIFDLDNAPIMWNGSYVNPHSAPLTPRLFSRCFSIFNLFCLGCARAHDFPVSVCSRRLCFFTDVAWSTRRTLPAQHPKERENRELTFNRWTHTKTHVLTLLCVCHHIYFKADVLKLKMFVFFLMLWASQTTFYSLVLRWRRKSCNIICNILKLGTKKTPTTVWGYLRSFCHSGEQTDYNGKSPSRRVGGGRPESVRLQTQPSSILSSASRPARNLGPRMSVASPGSGHRVQVGLL